MVFWRDIASLAFLHIFNCKNKKFKKFRQFQSAEMPKSPCAETAEMPKLLPALLAAAPWARRTCRRVRVGPIHKKGKNIDGRRVEGTYALNFQAVPVPILRAQALAPRKQLHSTVQWSNAAREKKSQTPSLFNFLDISALHLSVPMILAFYTLNLVWKWNVISLLFSNGYVKKNGPSTIFRRLCILRSRHSINVIRS